jgi:hypothetical protein
MNDVGRGVVLFVMTRSLKWVEKSRRVQEAE